jgi:hypothetical protein
VKAGRSFLCAVSASDGSRRDLNLAQTLFEKLAAVIEAS